MIWYRSAVLAALLAVIPSLSSAQQLRASASGFGGGFFPAGDLVNEVSGDSVLNFGHKTGWVAGGRVTLGLTSRLSVEAEAAFAGSDLEITNTALAPPINNQSFGANLFLASLNALLTVVDPPFDPFELFVSGGVGVVSGTGDGYDLFDSKTNVAGVAGLGFRYGVSPLVNIRIDLKDYIYAFKDESLEIDAESRLQNQILVTGGVELVFGTR